MRIDLHCQSPYFEMIKNGRKIIEGRLAKDKYVQLQAGDVICFNNELETRVVAVRKYPTFRDLILHEGVNKVLPGHEADSAPHMVYRAFYSEEDERTHGVVAIEITLLA